MSIWSGEAVVTINNWSVLHSSRFGVSAIANRWQQRMCFTELCSASASVASAGDEHYEFVCSIFPLGMSAHRTASAASSTHQFLYAGRPLYQFLFNRVTSSFKEHSHRSHAYISLRKDSSTYSLSISKAIFSKPRSHSYS